MGTVYHQNFQILLYVELYRVKRTVNPNCLMAQKNSGQRMGSSSNPSCRALPDFFHESMLLRECSDRAPRTVGDNDLLPPVHHVLQWFSLRSDSKSIAIAASSYEVHFERAETSIIHLGTGFVKLHWSWPEMVNIICFTALVDSTGLPQLMKRGRKLLQSSLQVGKPIFLGRDDDMLISSG